MKKIIIGLILVIIIIALVYLQFGPYFYSKFYFSKTKTPASYQIPDTSNITPITNISAYPDLVNCKIKFNNPFGNVLENAKIPKGADCDRIYKFGNNKSVSFVNLGEKWDPTQVNDFDYLKNIFYLTPDSISLIESRSESVKKSANLIVKNAVVSAHKYYADGLYVFRTDSVQGFMFGKPGVSQRVDLAIYDSNGNNQQDVLLNNITDADSKIILSSLTYK